MRFSASDVLFDRVWAVWPNSSNFTIPTKTKSPFTFAYLHLQNGRQEWRRGWKSVAAWSAKCNMAAALTVRAPSERSYLVSWAAVVSSFAGEGSRPSGQVGGGRSARACAPPHLPGAPTRGVARGNRCPWPPRLLRGFQL